MSGSKLLEPFAVEWGSFAPLRLRARAIAEGVWAGAHRSVRKGAGVEFGGQRAYVPGDDLRYLDRRSLLRHDRLLVREFETETENALWLVLDASASMRFVGHGPSSKWAFASVVLAALARLALAARDPVGVVVCGTDTPTLLPPSASSDAFDRIVDRLESTVPESTTWSSEGSMVRALGPVLERARRGSRFVFASDFVDLPTDTATALASLGTRDRRIHALSVLSPDEASLPFDDAALFRATEGSSRVEADPSATRAVYLERLTALRARWRTELATRGGTLLHAVSNLDPVAVVRELARDVSGIPRPTTSEDATQWV